MWKLHKRNILVTTAGLAAILIFIFAGILPNKETLARQDAEIKALTSQIASEKRLVPIYQNLKKELDGYPPCALPNPEIEPLGRDEADRITGLLETTARKTHMKLIGAVPDINSLTETGTYLSVALKLSGKFPDFRDFLTRLGDIACVRHVGNIQITPMPGSKEFDVTAWFAIKGSRVEDKAKKPKESQT